MSRAVAKHKKDTKQVEETRLQGLAAICSTLVVGLFVLTFVFQNFVIPSASMASTLLVGDHIMVERVTLSPSDSSSSFLPYRPLHRGEPIVFNKPVADADGKYSILIKRVVGLPGDRIHLQQGILYLNGVAQNEPQTAKPTYANYDPYRDDFPSISPSGIRGINAEWSLDLPTHIQNGDLVVPKNSYFVLGDNRTNSLDGRYWGFVSRENLIGRPLFVYWSFEMPDDQRYKTTLSDRASFALHEFTHFFDETRWSRTFHKVE